MELAFICRRVHTELEGTAILSRSRGGTDSSNPLSSSGESRANELYRQQAEQLRAEKAPRPALPLPERLKREPCVAHQH